MSRLRTLLKRLSSVFRKQRLDQDLHSELQAHLELLTRENIRRGMNPKEAAYAARREFGGVEQTKELYRDQRSIPFLDALLEDLRFALRMLAKSPGFTAVTTLTLALGIGANSAIFSAVNAILLRTLPYAHASKLVRITGVQRFSGEAAEVEGLVSFSVSTWRLIQKQAPAIEQMAIYSSQESTLTGETAPEKLSTAFVSGDFFSVLGVPPILGRPLLPADSQPGHEQVAVLSYGLWRGILGGEPAIVGRRITLDQKAYEVVGVMPPEFEFASGKRGAWIPFPAVKGEQENIGQVVARLQADVSLAQADAQLETVGSRIAAGIKTNKNWKLVSSSVKEGIVGGVRNPLLILFGAVGFLLLIACVNVSGLLLARGWMRQREVAIRAALGATRLRIVRQFLVESILIALAGGALGVLVSFWGIRVLRSIAPPATPRIDQLSLDTTVLWFTLGVALLAGVLVGLAPAIQISAEGPGKALKQSRSGSASGLSLNKPHRLRSALFIIEVALAVVLVIGATLMARSFEKLTTVDLGLRTDHLLTMKVNLSNSACGEGKPEKCQRSVSDVLRSVRSLSGVENAAAVSTIPVEGGSLAFFFQVEGQAHESGLERGAEVGYRAISPEYFHAMGIHLLGGRGFSDSDKRGAPRVAIVNETFTRQFFPGCPLGRRIRKNDYVNHSAEWLEIIGEVSDSRDFQINHRPLAEYYVPFAQDDDLSDANLVVRTSADPFVMAAAVREQVWAIDKNAPITSLRTMDQVVAETVAEPRFRTFLLCAFGALGLVMAMVGVFGVICYTVSQRTHEIGVRMALGARPREVLWMIVGDGMFLAGIGVAAGLTGSLALTKLLEGLLFEVKPTDPLTFVFVPILLPLVALVACYIPARRAVRVDPMIALRYE